MDAINRGEIDDMARSALDHGRCDSFCTEATAEQIDINNVDIVLEAECFKFTKTHNTGIIDKQVWRVSECGKSGGDLFMA